MVDENTLTDFFDDVDDVVDDVVDVDNIDDDDAYQRLWWQMRRRSLAC